MSPNRSKVAADARLLRDKARAIKRTQRRLLQQLDESIRNSELRLEQAKARES
jgi:hypothetical protein